MGGEEVIIIIIRMKRIEGAENLALLLCDFIMLHFRE